MDWKLLQIADSIFPTGGFAHSAGLEAASQLGEFGADGLEAWARQAVWQAGCGALPFVGAGHDAPGELAAIDARCDAFLSNPVANRASRSQGRCFVAACAEAFGEERIARWSEDEDRPLHHAPAFGAAASVLGASKRDAARLYLFMTLRSGISAGVRLGLAGPLEAQRVQAGCAKVLEDALDRCWELPLDSAAQTAPLLDLFQSAQDRLYSRLFQS